MYTLFAPPTRQHTSRSAPVGAFAGFAESRRPLEIFRGAVLPVFRELEDFLLPPVPAAGALAGFGILFTDLL